MTFLKRALPSLLTISVLSSATTVVFATDYAIVAGVNHYSALEGADLHGCIADAKDMKDVLEKMGFKVLFLENPTKSDIEEAFDRSKSIVNGDRFTFYFAGHGAQSGRNALLLPSNFAEDNQDFGITKSELARWVASVQSRYPSVVLDSCFSEGAMRSKAIGSHFKARFYEIKNVRGDGNTKSLGNEGDQDTNDNIIDPDFAGFAACTRVQQAGEDRVEGQPRGLFTYCFTQSLRSQPNATWGELASAVIPEVARRREDQQNPVFAPSSRSGEGVFGTTSKPHPNSKKSLWDIYSETNFQPDKLRVKFVKDKDSTDTVQSVAQNQTVITSIEAGAEGYLFILNRDAQDRVILFQPRKISEKSVEELLADSRVESGTKKNLKTRANDLGVEKIKAILFSDRDQAKAFLEKFKESFSSGSARVKDLSGTLRNLSQVDDYGFVTASAEIEVRPAGYSSRQTMKRLAIADTKTMNINFGGGTK
jgi:Caspase domain